MSAPMEAKVMGKNKDAAMRALLEDGEKWGRMVREVAEMTHA